MNSTRNFSYIVCGQKNFGYFLFFSSVKVSQFDFSQNLKGTKMSKLHVEYKKNGKKVFADVGSKEIKKLLKEFVKIQISTRHDSFEVKDSILEFVKKYNKYGVKDLSKKYCTKEENIKNKLISLGIAK